MQNKFRLAIAFCMSLTLLAGCSSETTRIKRITEEPLTNGKTVKVGYTAPKPEWQCTLVETKSFTWSVEQFKAQFSFMQNGYTMLQKKALDYAKEKKLNVNYIYMDVPDQYEVIGLNLTAMSKAHVNYLQCKVPPAVSNKMF
jgi:hypothetical protein